VGTPPGRDPILALALSGGTELRYSDETRMGKIYVARVDQLDQIPGFASLGVDLLSEDFTLPYIRRLVARRRDQVRQFLLDKTGVWPPSETPTPTRSSSPRAYTPRPFATSCSRRSAAPLCGYPQQHWIAPFARSRPATCPSRSRCATSSRCAAAPASPALVCGTTIRRVRVGRDDACFCPICQPPSASLSWISQRAEETNNLARLWEAVP